jgi:hypothetical protein
MTQYTAFIPTSNNRDLAASGVIGRNAGRRENFLIPASTTFVRQKHHL